jgi:hypothetical protein
MVDAMSLMRDGLPCLIHSFVGAHSIGKVPVIVGTFADCCSEEARPPAFAIKSAMPGSLGLGCEAGGGGAVAAWGGAEASAGESPPASSLVVARGMAVTGRTGRLTGIGTLC